jgi:hypothetical protein
MSGEGMTNEKGTWKRSYSLCVAKVMNQMAKARISPNLKYKE